MTHQRYKKNVLFGLIGITLYTGCMDEQELDVCPDCQPEETMYVVDYAIGETMGRSVSHEALPAHKRIKSLTYLLYNKDSVLVKQREIPDIAQMKETDWPMKRSTMTWKQRDALRDTLLQNQKYIAVFVANANPQLFGGEEVLHLTEIKNDKEIKLRVDQAYLSLPQTTAFHDGNMFYRALCEIQPDKTFNRDTPYNCPVRLQRIVCRTDFFSDDYPAWGTEFAQDKIRKFSNRVYYQLFTEQSEQKTLFDIKGWLKNFTDSFYKFALSKGYSEIPTFKSWAIDLTMTLNEEINYAVYLESFSAEIQQLLFQKCLENESLKKLWLPWKGLKAKISYTQAANCFYLSNKKSAILPNTVPSSSPLLDIIELSNNEQPTKKVHSFTLIGFGENSKATLDNVQNRIHSVQLYEGEAWNTTVTELPLPEHLQSFTEQGGNERIQLMYCPIKTLTYNSTSKLNVPFLLQPVDLESQIIQGMESYHLFSKYLEEFLLTEEGHKFGTNMKQFILKILLPDLSQKDALTVIPEWTIKQ